MSSPGAVRASAAKRRVIRVAVICFLLVGSAFIVAEWLALELGFAEGSLITAGLVLCVSANLLSVLLLIAKRER